MELSLPLIGTIRLSFHIMGSVLGGHKMTVTNPNVGLSDVPRNLSGST